MAFQPIKYNFRAPLPQEVPNADYTYDADPQKLLKDPRFLKDIRDWGAREGHSDAQSWTDDEAVRQFYASRTWRNWNTLGIAEDLYDANTSDEPQRARIARLQKAWEIAPSRGISDLGAWRDYAGALIADPLNLVGGAAAEKAAVQAGVKLAEAGVERLGRGTIARAAAKAGAKREAIAGAGIGALQDTMRQNANVDLGLQDGFSYTQLGASTLGGAAAGGTLGGGIGGLTGAISAGGIRRDLAKLGAEGVDPGRFAGATRRELRDAARDPSQFAAPEPEAFGTEPDLTDPLTPEPTPTSPYDPAVAAAARQAAEQQYDRLQTERASRSMVTQARRNVVKMQELEKLANIISASENNTDVLLAGDDATRAAIGQKNAARIAELQSLYRRLSSGDASAALIDEVAKARETIETDIAQTAQPTPEGGAAAPAEGGAAPSAEAPAPTPEPVEPVPAAETIAADNPVGAAETIKAKRSKKPKAAEPAPEPEPAPAPVEVAAEAPKQERLADGPGQDAYDELLDNQREVLAGNPHAREIINILAKHRFPELANEIMARFDAEHGEQESKAAGTSMADQLKGVLGKLVSEKALAKGSTPEEAQKVSDTAVENAMRGQEQAQINAGLTPEEIIEDKAAKLSGTGRTAKTLAEGPVTAGRGESGKVQPILRQGQATERDPITHEATRTVTDGPAPTKRSVSREANELEAIQRKEITSWVANESMKGVIGAPQTTRTRANGSTKIIPGHVEKGTTVFFNPWTKKYYADEVTAMKASGLIPDDSKLRSRGVNRAEPAPPPETKTPQPADQQAALIQQLLAGKIDPEDYMRQTEQLTKRVEAIDPDPVISGRAQFKSPPAPAGQRLAVRRRDDPNDVRVLSDKQIAAGQDATSLIGSKGNPDDFEVGFVPENNRSFSQGARESFRPADAAELSEVAEPQVGPKGIAYEDLPKLTADLTTLAPEDVAKLKRLTGQLFGAMSPFDDKALPLLDLEKMRVKLENWRWLKDRKGLQTLTDYLAFVNGLQAKFMPDGLRLPTQSKLAALEDIDRVFAGHDPREIQKARDFLTALAGDDAPILRGDGEEGASATDAHRSFSPDPKRANIVTIRGASPLVPGKIGALYHEVAHWSYDNILTPEDRAAFWKAMNKYYTTEGVDFDAIKARAPETPKGFVGGNQLDSPQEFFANQFTAWVMRKPDLIWQDEGFWQKITRIAKNVFDRFFGDDYIDADLEPLFSKIIPDPKEEAEFAGFIPSGPLKSKQSEFIVAHLNKAAMLKRDLQRALRNDNADTAIATAQDYAEMLYKMTSRANTFAPLVSDKRSTNLVTNMRDLAKRISDAIGQKADDETLQLMDEGSWDDADAASIWLKETGHGEVTDPGAAMDALNALFTGTPDSLEANHWYLNAQLNYRFRENEGSYLSPRQMPDTLKPAWLDRSPAKESVARMRRAQVADEGRKTKQIASAIDRARTPPAKRSVPEGGALPPTNRARPATPSVVRDATLDDLIATFSTTKKKATKDGIAAEVMRRIKAQSNPVVGDVAIPRDILAARAPDLEVMLRQAMDEGDGPRINQILSEGWRRAQNKRLKAAGEPLIKPQISNEIVRKSIAREAQDAIGDFDEYIMPAARASVREMQSYMSHRDPEVQGTMRTLLYRSLNLMGKTVQGTLKDTNLMSVGDIHRLAGLETPPDAAGVFADFRAPAFNKMRSDLRKLSIGLTKNVSNPFDAMHEVYHLALRTGLFTGEERDLLSQQFAEAARRGEKVAMSRLAAHAPGKSVDQLSMRELEDVAEEWFAEHGALYSMGKVAKGDMFAIRESGDMVPLTAKARLVTLANHLTDGVAYLVNGLVGRNDIKQMFRRVNAYGDLFAGNQLRLRSNARTAGIAEEYASAHYGQLMRSMPRERLSRLRDFTDGGLGLDDDGLPLIFYHGTPNGDRLADPETVMMPGRGDYGRGIYLTTNPKVANTVYAKRPTYLALRRRAKMLFDDGAIKDDVDYQSVQLLLKNLELTRRDLGSLARDRYAMREASGGTPDTLRKSSYYQLTESELNREIDQLRAQEGATLDELERLGMHQSGEVYATVVRAKNPVDLRRGASYSSDSPQVAAIGDGMLDMGFDQGTVESFKARLGDDMGGDALHRELVRFFKTNGDSSQTEAALDQVNELFGRMGHDSIWTTHRNTPNPESGEVVLHPTLILLDHVDPKTGNRVSASQLVKSVESSAFDAEDARFYYSKLQGSEPPNSFMIAALTDGTPPASNELISQSVARMDETGTPGDLASTLINMARQRLPGAKEFQSFKRLGTAIFGSNSKRLEENGLRSLASWHSTQFIDHASELAKRVYAFKEKLNELPDTPTAFRRWLRNSNPIQRPAQPESYARIVSALRHGDGTPQFARLSEKEKDVARTISGLLRAELQQMRRDGVIVGDIKNYFPQVWNVQAMSKDPDAFMGKLANYFQAEASQDGRKLERADALGRAKNMWAKLVEEDGHYIPPPVGASRSAMSDHVDFQRMIRLDDPEFSANLKELEPFLENDLEGILVKYFDGTVRRSIHSRRWGAMNHGYFDYLRVADEGRDGIAALLSSNRVTRKDLKTFDDNGYAVTLELRDEAQMPFKDDPAAARKAADEVLRVFNEEGEVAAKRYLMGLDPNDPPTGKDAPDTSTYEHRVNAIIDGIRDFGGEAGMVPPTEITFAQDALRLAMRKQVEGGPMGTPAVRTFSRGLRTFNAVTMLSYTVLTSLPDLIMPMIRSGNAQAHIKALTRLARDPIYRRQIQRTGVAIESIAHQRMAGLFGADVSGKIGMANNAFFNATLLTPWTDMNRTIAGAVGFEAFKADIERLGTQLVGDGADISAQPPEVRKILRRLSHYGLRDRALKGETLELAELDENPDLRRAIVKFANDAIFSPTPDDMPLWTQTPVGAILWQLKSYPLMLGRFAKDVLYNDMKVAVKDRNIHEAKRAAMFMTLGPAFGAASLGIKDLAQFRGGEDRREAQLQHRNILKFLGYDEKVHGDADDMLGWYAEGFVQMGGLGILSDVLHSTVENSDNGAYGSQRVAGTFLGPAATDFFSAYNVYQGVTDAKDSNASERSAAREIVKRIPVLGGAGAFKEAAVDAVAGEARDNTLEGDDFLSAQSLGFGADDFGSASLPEDAGQ